MALAVLVTAEVLDVEEVIEPFAGPGGWDEALIEYGLHALGIEFERNAVATRTAAGHRSIHADVSQLNPADYPCRGFIASPPCQAFSNAGKGAGRDHMPALLAAIHARDWTARPDPDPKVWLVLEVGRWLDVLRPEWIALEQVPAVLPIWEAYAGWLRDLGYWVWCGILNAADFGVPQIRRRVILIASRLRPVHPPEPTHAAEPVDSLFGRLEPHISMAEGLGWGMSGRPAYTLAPGAGDSGGGAEIVGGSGARDGMRRELEEGRWVVSTGDKEPYERSIDLPSPTLTGAVGGKWIIGPEGHRQPPMRWKTRNGSVRARDEFDGTEQPSRTVTGKTRSWELNPGATESQPNRRKYSLEEPAPTLAFGHDAAAWVFERPATTIAGDERVFAPGSHIANDGRDNTKAHGRSEDTIKLSIVDALRLQSFRPDYPVQGSKSAKFMQVGNAIPPLLAWHVLSSVVDLPES